MTNEQSNELTRIFHGYIISAIEDSIEDHGPLTKEECRALTILVEEVGEAAAELLEIKRQYEGVGRQAAARRAVFELSQVAAMPILMIDNLKDEYNLP